MIQFVVIGLIAAALVAAGCDNEPESKGDTPGSESDEPSFEDRAECADEAPSVVSESPRTSESVTVYFSCAASVGGKDEPVYPFQRDPAQTPDGPVGMVEEGVRAYFNGPTETETDQGYIAAVRTPLPEALNHVTLDGNTATVDLAPEFQQQVPSLPSAAGRSLLRQLEATVFHVPGIERMRIQVDGDCARFWSLLQMTCNVLERSSPEHLNDPPDDVPSAPWKDPPSDPPN